MKEILPYNPKLFENCTPDVKFGLRLYHHANHLAKHGQIKMANELTEVALKNFKGINPPRPDQARRDGVK